MMLARVSFVRCSSWLPSLAACGGGESLWDGSPYEGRPVFGAGANQGVSQQLHDDAQKCGLRDETIEETMQGAVAGNVTDITAIYDVQDGGAVDVAFTALGGGVWELRLTCK